MIIYVVTDGEYSDYRIKAVFTEKERAEKYIKLYGGVIEEYEANKELIHEDLYDRGFRPFQIWYDVKEETMKIEERTFGLTHFDPNLIGPVLQGMGLWIHCYAKDKEHAAKIANERIMQKKALNQL